jgi:hypothetical protein
VRTWEENRQAINQLWPMVQFTDEERKLWSDDLKALDQAVLYDAIRNAKRNNDSLYPQLKWIRDEYRSLEASRKWARGSKSAASPEHPRVSIDKATNERNLAELKALVEVTEPCDFRMTVDVIADKASSLQIEMATAFRLVKYLLRRLGMSNGGSIGDAA